MEYVQGNILIRPAMHMAAAGAVVEGHSHNFDHTTYVVRGAVHFERLNDEGEVVNSVVKRALDGYNFVLIKAGVKHRLTALEDDTIAHCIYAHRTPQGEVVQDYDGWSPGYH